MAYDPKHALQLLRIGSGRGDATFRDGQEDAIRHIVEGKGRLLVVQKTGWGKSFVYFIATKLLREAGAGPALLISPLLALMRNQIAAAERMGSADFRWAVMAIGIQREVGGNLAELLMTVADTMVARERLRRDVDALTAEGKVSAMVLGFLPIGLGAAMWVINPEYIGVLFSERLGNIMLAGAGLLAGFGFWWMKKLIEIDV